MFRVIQAYQQVMENGQNVNLLSIFDGPSIERWLVKFLLGGLASQNLGLQDRQKTELHVEASYDPLFESLFRRSSVVPEWTLYQHGPTDSLSKSAADIEFAVYHDSDLRVTGCAAAIGTTCLMLALTEIALHVISRNFIVRPAGFVTDSAVADTQTYLGLSWPSSSARISRGCQAITLCLLQDRQRNDHQSSLQPVRASLIQFRISTGPRYFETTRPSQA